MFRLALGLTLGVSIALGAVVDDALRLERSGRALEARELLARAAADAPSDASTQFAYAEFLDRYGDSAAAAAYKKALDSGLTGPAKESAQARLAGLSLSSGNVAEASTILSSVEFKPFDEDADYGYAEIPGLFNSFLRMAALSTDLEPKQLLPALARNIVTGGYRSIRGESLEKTEYLKLIERYLSQARELAQLAGPEGRIVIPACESAETAQILKILGYRLRGECGPEAVLETVNPSRAFLSIDSAFPLADLEDAYRRDKGFELDYKPTKLPVLFGPDYWIKAADGNDGNFIDAFLSDPAAARLYVALSKLHRPTASALRQDVAADRLKNYANVLDFFGASFEIQNGAAVVPGGASTAQVWQDFTGASVAKGADFFQKLIEADDGWMAAYYDAIARTTGAKRAYFSNAARIERFYTAMRGRVTSPGPARPIFRATAELLMLTARLDLEDSAMPHIPGGLEPWKKLFVEHPHGKYDGKLTRSAKDWTSEDDLVEALFGLSRKVIENEPLRMFLAISNLDRGRSQPLSPATVERLLLAYPTHGSQFAVLNEADLDEASIADFLDVVAQIDKIGRVTRRADAAGSAQALAALWQIFVRQGQIGRAQAGPTLQSALAGFKTISGDAQVFTAARDGLTSLLKSAGADTANPQAALVNLLAGHPGDGEAPIHAEMVTQINTLFNQQRLIALDTLVDLADHFERVQRGESFNVAMANRLAETISEKRLPESEISTQESNILNPGDWVANHIDRQRALNIRRSVDRAAGDANALGDILGELAPLLRDTLVGFTYIFYSPPGAELIRSNPLFVRTHDFIGSDSDRSWRAARLAGSGWPNSSGGQLVGSLAGLPYALNDAEQNFLIPSERQALIWQDLAPQVLLGATTPRWWDVSSNEVHLVALHLRLGRALMAESVSDEALRERVFALLTPRVEPARRWNATQHLAAGQVDRALEEIAPAELFELARRALADSAFSGHGEPFASSARALLEDDDIDYQTIAARFGQPHPTLSTSYRSELLGLPLFPTMMGFSSRILAESWESSNLYWADLADQMHVPPAELNLRIPEWTQRTLERIFATHLEDWPALLRSMRIVGDRYRIQLEAQMNARISSDATAGSALQ